MSPEFTLPPDVALVCQPLWKAIPFEQSMPLLNGGRGHVQAGLMRSMENEPALVTRPLLLSALWLYVDDLDQSHEISQAVDNETAAWWHGIMHRREGDYDNSRYWLRRCARHPLRAQLDPVLLVADVECECLGQQGEDSLASGGNDDSFQRSTAVEALLNRQRDEWKTLFEWTALNLPSQADSR